MLGRPASLLLKSMKYKDGISEFRDVEYPILPGGMYPNLNDSWPDRGHGPVVVRILSQLNQVQLVAGLSAGFFWKVADVV